MSEQYWTHERRAQKAEEMRARNADPAFAANKTARYRLWREQNPPAPYRLPEHAHPLVRGLYVAINAERCRVHEVADRADINHHTVRQWRTLYMPRVDLLDAALNTLDLELAIVPRGRRDRDGFYRRRRQI